MKMEKLTQRQLQALERRQEILDAAKNLFALNGYHATTTRSINKAIGMADGLMYHYFPEGKMQILETLVQEEVDRKRESVSKTSQSIEASTSLRDQLTEIGRIILDAATRDREMMVIMMREYHVIKDKFSEPVIEFSGFYHYVANHLKSYMDKGEIRTLDPLFVAVQFISPFSVYTMTKVLMDDGDFSYFGMDDETFLKHNVDCTLKILELY